MVGWWSGGGHFYMKKLSYLADMGGLNICSVFIHVRLQCLIFFPLYFIRHIYMRC